MTPKTDTRTKTLQTNPQRDETPDRPTKAERPGPSQRKAPRAAAKRAPRLPAYVRHA